MTYFRRHTSILDLNHLSPYGLHLYLQNSTLLSICYQHKCSRTLRTFHEPAYTFDTALEINTWSHVEASNTHFNSTDYIFKVRLNDSEVFSEYHQRSWTYEMESALIIPFLSSPNLIAAEACVKSVQLLTYPGFFIIITV